MPENHILILKHILNSITEIEEYTQGVENLTDFLDDQKTVRATERNLEIIGEAVKKIPESLKSEYNSIEWRKIAGIRDIIIHNYDGVDYEIVFDVIQNKLKPLHTVIDSMIQNQEEQ